MKTANTLRRVRLGRPRQPWTDTTAAYLSAPDEYWPSELSRHVERIEASTRAVGERDGLHETDIIDGAISMAGKRRIDRPAGVHVTGLRASGAQQLTRMLDGVRGLVSVGEVDVPDRLLDDLRGYSDADQACAIDAIHILHGWADTPDVWAGGIVGWAESVHRMPLYKRWYPATVAVHTVQDPREQVRAAVLDREQAPHGVPDAENLRRLTLATEMSFRDYRAVGNDVDVLCRCEDLHTKPRDVLRRILGLLPRSVDDADIEHVTSTSSEIPQRRATPAPEDPAQQRLLHAYLVDVIRGLGYPPGDCVGTHLPDSRLPARQLRFRGAPPGPLYRRCEGIWVTLDGSGGTRDVPAGIPVLLRIGAGDAGGLAAVESCDADDLQAVCVASNDTIDDNALRCLRGLRGLQTLDLARTRVTDRGLSHLDTLIGLQQLHLADTQTTPAGRARLAKRLPQVTMWA